jgi:hypothetical protein
MPVTWTVSLATLPYSSLVAFAIKESKLVNNNLSVFAANNFYNFSLFPKQLQSS